MMFPYIKGVINTVAVPVMALAATVTLASNVPPTGAMLMTLLLLACTAKPCVAVPVLGTTAVTLLAVALQLMYTSLVASKFSTRMAVMLELLFVVT